MPVTARLSKLFYERLGEQVANELVDWFNAVDTTYRSDLRELNEQNFARFDAKLEQRLAVMQSELRSELLSRAEFRAEIAGLATKAQIAGLATKAEIAGLATKADLADLRAELIKWMFLFWAGTSLAGLLYR